MQLFSYNPHPFSFYSFLLFNNMIYFFSQHVLAFQHVFMVFLACFLAYAMIYRFDIVGLAFLGWDMSKFNVCAYIHMLLGSLPCLCLDLHAYVFFAMFMLRYTCLCFLCHAFAQIYMPMFRSMSLCVLRSICWLLCHVLLQPFCSLMPLFLGSGPFWWSVDLDLVVQAYIFIPKLILKGLDNFLYVYSCLLACFYALCLCLPVQIQDLPCFAPSMGLCLLVLRATCFVWLYPSLLRLVGM